ncbi:MAG: response regulator [Betaproteobacteria bacterium]|nr:response regulator [Betaproteobacteria bacterium]
MAGRGIGMDVVRSETAALGGRVELNFTAGAGSQFIIYLPLTLAVTQAVLVRAGAHSFAVPSVMVEHVGQFWPEQLEAARRERSVAWQERRRAFHDLSELLGMEAEPLGKKHQASVMFLKSGSNTAALHIDDIIGSNQEIVVKTLGPQLQRLPGIAGATVLGSGEIALTINLVLLAQQHALRVAGRWAEEAVGRAPKAAVHAPPPPPSVMVVDDSLTVRKFTGRLIERHGYELMVARDGVEALEKLRDTLPDVMLVDIEMPRMDGLELTRTVRADPRLAHIPVIIISSRTAEKHRSHAGEIGVSAFLGKPYPEDELLALIAGFVKNAPA